jgi:hypothetical protein
MQQLIIAPIGSLPTRFTTAASRGDRARAARLLESTSSPRETWKTLFQLLLQTQANSSREPIMVKAA